MATRHSELPTFSIGAPYIRRTEIHDPFGGSRQSGISPSKHYPAIFLFTGQSGSRYGYRDGYNAQGVFLYTGEGQTGDMTFTKGNKAVRDHAFDGRALHLFEANTKGAPCTYLGEFTLASHEMRRGPDRNGLERNAIVFHLVPVAQAEAMAYQRPSTEAAAISLQEARDRAIAACTGRAGAKGEVLRTLYERSAAVRDYVLKRANGQCEVCHEPAPFFTTDRRPFLEVHHTRRLSDGGLDHPRFVVAACPNCHRRLHFGADGAEANRVLMDALEKTEGSIWV